MGSSSSSEGEGKDGKKKHSDGKVKKSKKHKSDKKDNGGKTELDSGEKISHQNEEGRNHDCDEIVGGSPAATAAGGSTTQRQRQESVLLTHQPSGGFAEVSDLTASISLPDAQSVAPSQPARVNDANGRPPPVRLTQDAIAATAYNWTKPPIGHGGFSNVYEGTFYQKSVAVKVLTIRDAGERKMFDEELMALLNQNLWHVNIVPLLAYCDVAPAFIFPKLKPLSKDRLPRLPTDVRDVIVIDVAEGLSHMHKAGFVHSDMKPDNVLLEFDDNRIIKRALVGDMGCVKSCSTLHAPFGTVIFLDPGLAPGPQYPKHADDTYSFGLTVLCIFTGRFPETQLDLQNMFLQMDQADPVRANIIRRMTQPDWRQRPSCAQVADEFRNLQQTLQRGMTPVIPAAPPPLASFGSTPSASPNPSFAPQGSSSTTNSSIGTRQVSTQSFQQGPAPMQQPPPIQQGQPVVMHPQHPPGHPLYQGQQPIMGGQVHPGYQQQPVLQGQPPGTYQHQQQQRALQQGQPAKKSV